MKLFIKRTILLTLVVFAFMLSYGAFCDWYFKSPDFFDHVDNKRSWCLKKEGGNYRLAVLGSSRAVKSFDMPMLASASGGKVINLGCNGSGFVDNYLILHRFLVNNHNSIDVLLLQVDIYSLSSSQSFSNSFHTYQFLPYWDEQVMREGIGEYITGKERILWTYFPASRYFKYNRYFSPKEVVRRFKFRNMHSPLDELYGGTTGGGDEEFIVALGDRLTYRTLDPRDVAYLKKILALCEQKNIKVISYRAPEYTPAATRITNYQEVRNRVDSIMEKTSIPYVHPDASIESRVEMFSDPLHLNEEGMKSFAGYFIDRLAKL